MATSRRSLEPGSTVTSPAWPGAAHPGAEDSAAKLTIALRSVAHGGRPLVIRSFDPASPVHLGPTTKLHPTRGGFEREPPHGPEPVAPPAREFDLV
jgi:hypothetical protein